MSKLSIPSWRTIAAQITAATKADPNSLRSIYDDREFRPARNASVWAQLSALLAQQRKAYREAVAKGCLKEVQHTMLRRCFAHDYSHSGKYMITMVVPERGSNPFGTVKGDVRYGRKGLTLTPTEAAVYAHLSRKEGPLRLELTPLGAAMQEALKGITANYPMVLVHKAQLMPDHLHLILEVTAPIVSSNGTPRHLGHIIAGYKAGCNKLRRMMIAQQNCATPSASTPPSSAPSASNHPSSTPSASSLSASAPSSSSHSASTVSVVELCSTNNAGANTNTFVPLWAEGYTDTIILSRRHMATEEAYLDDNIYRLRMKQLHRDLFRTVHHIRINGKDYAALGNIHLLRKPRKEQVQYHHWEQDVPAGYSPCDPGWHCQRFYYSAGEPQNTAAPNAQNTTTPNAQNAVAANAQTTTAMQVSGSSPARIFTIGAPIQGPTEAAAHTERLMKAGDEGAVFVSPFISETEKAIRDAALTMGIPYIRLTREGFRDLYTPTKSEFEACCEGNLLLLAPWEDRRRTATITRRECMELNHIAQHIVNGNLTLLLINETIHSEHNNNTIIPRDDE